MASLGNSTANKTIPSPFKVPPLTDNGADNNNGQDEAMVVGPQPEQQSPPLKVPYGLQIHFHHPDNELTLYTHPIVVNFHKVTDLLDHADTITTHGFIIAMGKTFTKMVDEFLQDLQFPVKACDDFIRDFYVLEFANSSDVIEIDSCLLIDY